MPRIPFRPAFAAASLLTFLAGVAALAIVAQSGRPAEAYTRYTIEVDLEGFNPRLCRINRGDQVNFLNVADVPIRVYQPGFGGLPSTFDFVLAPGETSQAQSYTAGDTDEFFSGEGHFVTVMTPPTSNTWQTSCAKEAPTPTPTATATASPTPTPAPPRPAHCTWVGCAIGLALSSDG